MELGRMTGLLCVGAAILFAAASPDGVEAQEFCYYCYSSCVLQNAPMINPDGFIMDGYESCTDDPVAGGCWVTGSCTPCACGGWAQFEVDEGSEECVFSRMIEGRVAGFLKHLRLWPLASSPPSWTLAPEVQRNLPPRSGEDDGVLAARSAT